MMRAQVCIPCSKADLTGTSDFGIKPAAFRCKPWFRLGHALINYSEADRVNEAVYAKLAAFTPTALRLCFLMPCIGRLDGATESLVCAFCRYTMEQSACGICCMRSEKGGEAGPFVAVQEHLERKLPAASKHSSDRQQEATQERSCMWTG